MTTVRSPRAAALVALALVLACSLCSAAFVCQPASAVILAPATIDGPSPLIAEFGGAAASEDG
ncbi:MAG TPA: hypothetical protein VMS02_08230, partial [Solirubrobacteraceae bacterium]|nr:hypothetical protein [Solirubrobacteraceae bacterium]